MVDLVTLTHPRSAAAEAFRMLRTNLMLGDPQKPLHTLLLTSAAQADRKSEALANLAVTFAQSGHRTILVDCDLRKPTQHILWGVSGEKGITNLIQDDASLASPPLVVTSIENLSVLPAGPLPDVPADIVSSQRISEVLGVLKARADYILVEAPPVLVASDAVMLASKVDGVLMVVRAGATRRDHVAQAHEALQKVHARFIGAVLTNTPKARTAAY